MRRKSSNFFRKCTNTYFCFLPLELLIVIYKQKLVLEEIHERVMQRMKHSLSLPRKIHYNKWYNELFREEKLFLKFFY